MYLQFPLPIGSHERRSQCILLALSNFKVAFFLLVQKAAQAGRDAEEQEEEEMQPELDQWEVQEYQDRCQEMSETDSDVVVCSPFQTAQSNCSLQSSKSIGMNEVHNLSGPHSSKDQLG